MKIFKKYFYNKEPMTEKEYTYAKVGFTIDAATAGSANNFTAGSYLAGLLAFLGASEAESNFIISLTLFAGFFQILLPFITKNMTHKKPFVYFCRFFDRMPMGLMFLTPFIFGVGKTAVIAIGVLCMIAYTLTYMMSPVYNEWFMNCISRGGGIGKFCGLKDAVTNGALIVTFFVAAQITKNFTGESEIYGYMWLGIITIGLWAIEMTAMFFVKEPYAGEVKKEESEGILKSFKTVFTYKKLRPYLVYNFIYYFGIYLMNSLTNVMYVQRMKMPLELLSYMLVGDLILRTILAPVFGRISDRIGSKKVLTAGLIVLAVSFSLNAFMTAENAVALRFAIAVISAVAWTMLGAPAFAFLFESLPEKNRSSCMACMTSMFLLLGYLSSLVTTWFIGVANGLEFNVFGMKFSEMGLVFLVGSTIIFISALTLILRKKKK